MASGKERLTVRVSNIPKSATAEDILYLFESLLGNDAVYACDIATEHKTWKSIGFGRVQLETLLHRNAATQISHRGNLVSSSSVLSLFPSSDDIVARPTDAFNRVGPGTLHSGVLESDHCMCVLESWDATASVMPERYMLQFFLKRNDDDGDNVYKLEIPFDYVLESSACSSSSEHAPTNHNQSNTYNALLLKLKYAPNIFQKNSGPNVNSKLSENRYFICKEDYGFVWARTIDFSLIKSIWQSSSLCFEFKKEAALEVLTGLPFFKKDMHNLVLEKRDEFSFTGSGLVPLVRCHPDCKLSYETFPALFPCSHPQNQPGFCG